MFLHRFRGWAIALGVALALALGTAACADYRQGEVLVRYRPGAQARLQAGVASVGGQIALSIDQIRTHLVRLPAGMSVEEAVGRLRSDPNVEYAGPNHIVRICLQPNDEYFLDPYIGYYWQWGLYDASNPNAGIDVTKAWNITTGSSSVTIALVDTGVYSEHEDLYMKIVPGRNVITGAPDPTDTEDDHGHGTFTAGIAAAMTNNTIGVAGVSWGAKIMPIKALDADGYGTEADAGAGIVWAADHGAKVISMSFGGYDDVPAEKSACEYAYGKGCVLVAASGNDDTTDLFYPACYEQVIAVGATDEYMQRCTADDWGEGGSNYGGYLDVMAPGNNILSTTWDYTGGTYDMASGTSAAAPFVSGIAALVLGYFNNWGNAQVATQIKLTCKDIGTAGWDQYTGWGIASAYKALTSQPLQSKKIGELTALADGTMAKVADAVITSGSGDMSDRMYIEQSDRASAIMLSYSTPPAGYLRGDVVEAIGTLGRVNGERALMGASLTKTSAGDQLRPLSMPNKAVGGAALGNKPGVDGGVGANNVSLLVNVWGRVTGDFRWTYFYVDDGCGLADGSGLVGLKVICGSIPKPARDSYVRVTGIVSCEQPAGTGLTIPVVRIRKAGDIVAL